MSQPREAHVLVADDEQGMRDMLAFELGQAGYVVTLAVDGADALGKLGDLDVDLVITDVRMPGANGVEVLRRAKQACPSAEVIVVTGHADTESAVACLKNGACDLLHKPFHLQDFLSAVERALEHRRLARAARLHEAFRALLAPRTDEPLAERIGTTAMKLLDADDACVILVDDSRSPRVAYASCAHGAPREDARLALAERVMRASPTSWRPTMMRPSDPGDSLPRGLDLGRVRATIACPLVDRGAVIGVLNVNRIASDRRFQRADLETTEIVAAHAALMIANERLVQGIVSRERLATVGELTTSIVHEINNPLTTVACAAEELRALVGSLHPGPEREGSLPTETRQLALGILSELDASAQMMTAIVDDVRGLSSTSLSPDDVFDANQALKSALRIAGPRLRKVATVATTFAEPLPVAGNPRRMSQVFLNLLVNAAHAVGSHAERRGVIAVQVRRQGDQVRVEVRDDGPGIPPDVLARVMEPFFTTKGSAHGSGLGLSISRDIVTEHGGTLELSSCPGAGATAVVTLPLALHARARGPRSRVLVVEDEEPIRRAFARYLGRRFDVVLASDGAEAMEVLRQDGEFDVVVSDVAMPRKSGIELQREVGERWPSLARSFVFVTATVLEPSQRHELDDLGTPVIPKPFDLGELAQVIERVIDDRPAMGVMGQSSFAFASGISSVPARPTCPPAA